MVRTTTRTSVGVLGLVALGTVAIMPTAHGVTGTQDLTAVTADAVAQALVGPGVTISNVNQTGGAVGTGLFTGGATSVGFDTGVVLSSGDIADVVGPTNDASGAGIDRSEAGDADLSALSGFTTQDASVLEFDFVPNGDTIYFRYVFASEEYNEYVNSQYNDVFAFYVNGVNCATVPDGAGGTLPVTVNSVNGGNPVGDLMTATNPALFRNNDLAPNPYATELDGLTVVLTCMSPVTANATNTMKLAIADASDGILDSAVFLEQGSLSTTPPMGSGKVTGGGSVVLDDGRVTFGTQVIQDEQGLRGNLQLNDHRIGARFHGYSVTSLSVMDDTATWSGAGRLNGEDGYTFTVTVEDNRNGNSAKKGDPDTISVVIMDSGGAVVWELGPDADLSGGNIVVH